jgi:putative glutamine amidotransferase
MKPVIGVLAHPSFNDHGLILNHSIGGDYIASLIKAGGAPLIIPVTTDSELLAQYAQLCDGFLVPGGIDVNPVCFDEGPHPLLGETSLTFDRFELKMIELILKAGKPMLGICRGIQIINVALGGTLYQDLSLQSPETFRHVQKDEGRTGITHHVDFVPGSRLHGIFGDRLYVNSFHHQAIRKLGDELTVTARASDGTIEAVECSTYPYLVAVQWHPENFIVLEEDPMLPLFEDFISTMK